MGSPDQARQIVASLDKAAQCTADMTLMVEAGIAHMTNARFETFELRGFGLTASLITGARSRQGQNQRLTPGHRLTDGQRLAHWSQYWSVAKGAVEMVGVAMDSPDLLETRNAHARFIGPSVMMPAFGVAPRRPYLQVDLATGMDGIRSVFFQPGIGMPGDSLDTSSVHTVTGFGISEADITDMRQGNIAKLPSAMHGRQMTGLTNTIGTIMTAAAQR